MPLAMSRKIALLSFGPLQRNKLIHGHARAEVTALGKVLANRRCGAAAPGCVGAKAKARRGGQVRSGRRTSFTNGMACISRCERRRRDAFIWSGEPVAERRRFVHVSDSFEAGMCYKNVGRVLRPALCGFSAHHVDA